MLFASHLASHNLTPQTIKTYLAGIRHMQITLRFPELKEFSSLPRLRMVQAGLKRIYIHTQNPSTTPRVRLPITPAVLRQIRDHWSTRARDPDTITLWAAAVTCFFGFFRSGEITIPSLGAFDPAKHLSWGDVATDNASAPRLLRIKLKQSKTDQFRQAVEIFVGKTGCPLCPVVGMLAYMAVKGATPRPPFLSISGWEAADQGQLHPSYQVSVTVSRPAIPKFRRA